MFLMFLKDMVKLLLVDGVQFVLGSHPFRLHISARTLPSEGAKHTEQSCPIARYTRGRFPRHPADRTCTCGQTRVHWCVARNESCKPNFQTRDLLRPQVADPVGRWVKQ